MHEGIYASDNKKQKAMCVNVCIYLISMSFNFGDDDDQMRGV